MSAALDLTPETVDLIVDRLAAKLLGQEIVPQMLTCEQFGAKIGRSAEYVQDRCRINRIKAAPGKPYRIPASELQRWLRDNS